MDFSHYTTTPVELAISLVNTDQEFSGEDAIADLEGLRAFMAGWSDEWEGAADPPEESDLPLVHELRSRLRAIFEADSEERAAEVLNRILEDNRAMPRVSTHNGAPHLHFEPVGSSSSRWLSVVTAMGLATVVVDHGIDRFGICAAHDCADVFVDTSRNRSRRHCSTSCASRENVAAYRRRLRDAD